MFNCDENVFGVTLSRSSACIKEALCHSRCIIYSAEAFEFSLSTCFENVIFDNELYVMYIVLFILAQSQILLGKNSFYKTLDITIVFLKQIFVIKTKF